MDDEKVNIINILGQCNCKLPEDGDKVFEILEKENNMWICTKCKSRNIYMNKYCNKCGKEKE